MTHEKELVRRIKAGDPRAFEDMVRLFEGKIYALGLRYTGNAHDARDICQEVFLRVYRFIGNFSEESRLSTWIYRIAANVCKDTVAAKSRSREVALESGDDAEPELEIADLRYCPERALEGLALREAIVESILQLPEKYRQAVLLRDINGLSYEEIAQALGVETGTVKSRIARGRERIRAFLLAGGNICPGQSSKEGGGTQNDVL